VTVEEFASLLANRAKFNAFSNVGPNDWNQWGGSGVRNNVVNVDNIATEWKPGKFDRKTGVWNKALSQNVKWVARLGSQSYGNPVVANGQIYVGTNNGGAWLERYPAEIDLGCLIAFNEADGAFLWQDSSEKLPTGRVHDWPHQGICCAPLVEGERLWYVTSRGEVKCLDTKGFHDDENDGPYTSEKYTEKNEADVIWLIDMMKEMQISQHNMCSCSVTGMGNILFVCTSNGVDESHTNIPAPFAPSFFAVDKNTGKVLWTDNSPGINILHGQWSSPAVAVIDGVPQVMFAGGDGWLYSFHATSFANGKPELLWKFDSNPKESEYILGGAGTRNEIIATPVVIDHYVYLAVGQDPEHGPGAGHLWCIDGRKRGDISPELAFNRKDPATPISHRRLRAVNPAEGDVAQPNPNSGVVWHFVGSDLNGNGAEDFEEVMHRSCGTVAVAPDAAGNLLLFIADFSGVFHCVDARTGKHFWSHDMFAAAWGSPLIVKDKVYIGDEDGDVSVFNVSTDPSASSPITVVNMGNSVYSTPIVANGILYVANRTHLFAVTPLSESGQ
jgi:outer membrane protein assembly factor BamB